MEQLPKITSCFGVIIEENQIPPRIYLVHNNADHLGPNREEGKPEGWGLPGGGGLDDEKPEETVRREVLGEAGLLTEIATRGKSEFGEILFEYKPHINNHILIFHLKKIDTEGFRSIEETRETRRVMLADLGSILKMPLAIKIVLGTIDKTKNPEGIYFSTRERIFGVLSCLCYDFYDLIPDLDKLMGEINREEVGGYIYNLLSGVMRDKNEIRERRAKFLRPDLDDPYEFREILDRYQPWIRRGAWYVSRRR